MKTLSENCASTRFIRALLLNQSICENPFYNSNLKYEVLNTKSFISCTLLIIVFRYIIGMLKNILVNTTKFASTLTVVDFR